ncbi:MAG: hypothetical protein RLY43_2476 [Bacteroidota bacterium]|jgi:hypothetical protein
MKAILKSSIERSKLREFFQSILPKMFYKGKDGREWANFTLFLNDEPDKYGNTAALCISWKEGEKYEKKYFLNFKPLDKPVEPAENIEELPTEPEVPEFNGGDDLPF